MIEDSLVNYGVLGVWTISLLYEKYKRDKEWKVVIERNTNALIKVTQLLKGGHHGKH